MWSPIWVLALGKGYLHNVVQVADLAGGWPVLDLEPTHNLEPQEKVVHNAYGVKCFGLFLGKLMKLKLEIL